MTVDRRAEAHLWLLLEETLAASRRGIAETAWAPWRAFREVAEALVDVGAIAPSTAAAIVAELDDALAVRRLVPEGAFTAAPWPTGAGPGDGPAGPASADAAVAWIEAQIERHLDLFVTFAPDARSWAAADLVRILGSPVRAFAAVGAGTEQVRRALEDVVASLAAVGIDAGRPPAPEATARREWVQYLRDAPAPLPEPREPTEARRPRTGLGTLGGSALQLAALAWSEDVVDVAVHVRMGVLYPEPGVAWHARILDDRGHLHLGPPAVLRGSGGVLRFRLRPGLGPGVNGLDLRLTRRGVRIETSVAL